MIGTRYLFKIPFMLGIVSALFGNSVLSAETHYVPATIELPAVRPLLDAPQWTNVGVTHDLAGLPRILSAERAEIP